MMLWSCDHARSYHKLKTWYLLFRKVYDHQTWQSGDLRWEEPTYGVTWSSDNLVMRIMWQIKSVIYPLWQSLWLQSNPRSHMFLWQPGHMWSFRKLKTDNRFLQITYGYRKLCRGLTYGEAKPIMKSHNFDDVTTKDRVSNWKFNISSSTKSIPPDLAGRWLMVTGSHPWSHMSLCSVARSHEKFTM